jgi:hypothetical protein
MKIIKQNIYLGSDMCIFSLKLRLSGGSGNWEEISFGIIYFLILFVRIYLIHGRPKTHFFLEFIIQKIINSLPPQTKMYILNTSIHAVTKKRLFIWQVGKWKFYLIIDKLSK